MTAKVSIWTLVTSITMYVWGRVQDTRSLTALMLTYTLLQSLAGSDVRASQRNKRSLPDCYTEPTCCACWPEACCMTKQPVIPPFRQGDCFHPFAVSPCLFSLFCHSVRHIRARSANVGQSMVGVCQSSVAGQRLLELVASV